MKFRSKSKGPPKGFLLGGPAYQNLVDSRHAGAMGSLAVRCQQMSYRTGFVYVHGCPVEMARNQIMETALATDYTWLVSADSDIYWPIEMQDAIIWIARKLAELDAPFAAVPIEQRNRISNVVALGEEGWRRMISLPMEEAIYPCKAIGTGLFVARLAWYREHWPTGPWFRTEWEESDGAPPGRFIGEDFWHCKKLRERYQPPLYAPVLQVTHAHRGTVR